MRRETGMILCENTRPSSLGVGRATAFPKGVKHWHQEAIGHTLNLGRAVTSYALIVELLDFLFLRG